MHLQNILKHSAHAASLLLLLIKGAEPPANEDSQHRQFDKFAWQLFITVNRSQGSGVFWETWATQDDVFGSATTRPTWKSRTQPILDLKPLFKTGVAGKEPSDSDQIAPCKLERGQEVRLNEPTVHYIAEKKLYSVEGQIALSKQGGIDFPTDSIEIKAFWDTIDLSEKDEFFFQMCNGKPYGLTALHIISKAIPNWTWATFEHVSTGGEDRYNPNQCSFIPCRDDFGASPAMGAIFQHTPAVADLFDKANMKDEWRRIWRHYRLIGTQADFVASDGKPTLLGNSVMEGPFGATSSCITCHSRSSIEVDGKGFARLQFSASQNESFNGIPSPCWYLGKYGLLKFGKLDFVWSLRKALSETGKPVPANFVFNDCS